MIALGADISVFILVLGKKILSSWFGLEPLDEPGLLRFFIVQFRLEFRPRGEEVSFGPT